MVEVWEKEAIKSNDAVAKVRLLEKYKDLVSVDANKNKTDLHNPLKEYGVVLEQQEAGD